MFLFESLTIAMINVKMHFSSTTFVVILEMNTEDEMTLIIDMLNLDDTNKFLLNYGANLSPGSILCSLTIRFYLKSLIIK